MRPIKFRGRSLDNGEWIYGDLIHKGDSVFIKAQGEEIPDIVDPSTVGQFSGLYDRNGKEIYEGDIVKDRKGGVDVITWDSLAFNLCVAYASSPNGVCANFFTTNPLEGLEVVGNRYDNPELLKTGKEE